MKQRTLRAVRQLPIMKKKYLGKSIQLVCDTYRWEKDIVLENYKGIFVPSKEGVVSSGRGLILNPDASVIYHFCACNTWYKTHVYKREEHCQYSYRLPPKTYIHTELLLGFGAGRGHKNPQLPRSIYFCVHSFRDSLPLAIICPECKKGILLVLGT